MITWPTDRSTWNQKPVYDRKIFFSFENKICVRKNEFLFSWRLDVKRMQYGAIRITIICTYRTDTMQLIFLAYSEIQNNVKLAWFTRYLRGK